MQGDACVYLLLKHILYNPAFVFMIGCIILSLYCTVFLLLLNEFIFLCDEKNKILWIQ